MSRKVISKAPQCTDTEAGRPLQELAESSYYTACERNNHLSLGSFHFLTGLQTKMKAVSLSFSFYPYVGTNAAGTSRQVQLAGTV
jgi:hypothetical protein